MIFFLKLIILFVSHFIVESFSRSHPFDTMSSLLDSMSKHYIEVGTWIHLEVIVYIFAH